MKKVLILFGKSAWKNENPFSDKKYQRVYEYMYGLAEKKGVEIFRASYSWYDFEEKVFKRAWAFKEGKWVAVEKVRPDLIYDKSLASIRGAAIKERIAKSYKIINDIEFSLVANNKFISSLIFKEDFKKYHRIRSKAELLKAASLIEGSRVVVKPVLGSGGKGVMIIDKKDLESVTIESDSIVQEFVDSSDGIKDIVKGVHDLRLVFINEDLIYSYVRQPAEGSLLANLAKGGSMFIVDKEKLPKRVLEIADRVQEIFSFYRPRIFTIDFIFDRQQRPWIVEFNTMPGLYFSEDQKDWQDEMYGRLIDTFIEEM